jgi:tetratricopeptide (TPR) repeat protein
MASIPPLLAILLAVSVPPLRAGETDYKGKAEHAAPVAVDRAPVQTTPLQPGAKTGKPERTLDGDLQLYYRMVENSFAKNHPEQAAVLRNLLQDPEDPAKSMSVADFLNQMQRLKMRGSGSEQDKLEFQALMGRIASRGRANNLGPGKIGEYIQLMGETFADSQEKANQIVAHYRTQGGADAQPGDETAQPVDDPNEQPAVDYDPKEKESDLVFREDYYDMVDEAIPASPVGPTGVGHVRQERGDHKGAIRHYEEAIQRGGDKPELHARLGRSYWHVGDYRKANAAARRALELDSRNREAFSVYKLTRGRVRASDVDLSRKVERKAKEELAASGVPEEPEGRISVWEPDRVERVIFEQAAVEKLKRSKQSARLHKESKSRLRVGDRKKALELLRRSIEADPENAVAYADLAGVYIEQKRFEEAIAVIEEGLASSPRSSSLWMARSLARNRAGDFEGGMRDASNAIKSDKRNAGGWFMRAFAKAGLRDREASELDLEQAARLDRRFRVKLAQAREMPEDADPLFLYDAMLAEGRAPPKAPEKPKPPWLYLVFGLVAASLAAVGLWVQPVRERISTAFRRKGEARPEDDEVYPNSGFWKGYRIERKIAEGGMGVVYEAVDTRLDRRVAIKCLREEFRDDVRERERFLSEARLVANLRHPAIVEINGIEEDAGEVYLVFEYVEGRTLYDALLERETLSLAEARDLFKEVCAALEFAHSKGVVHRDLKPANIMITVGGQVKVMDFGVARQAQQALEKLAKTNTVVGTPPYMSPEQEEGLVGKPADMYALGVCLYETLTGAQPFVGTFAGQLLKKREGRFDPASVKVKGLPPAVDALIADALHPDPEKRIGTAAEFYRRLAAAAEESVGSTPPPAPRA